MSKRYEKDNEYDEYQDYEEYTVDGVEEYYEEEKKSKGKKKKKGKKVAILVAELFAIAILSFTLVLLLMPNAKSWLLGTPVGKFFVKLVVSEEDYKRIYDDNFDRENLHINDDLDDDGMEGYYNIALFGLDSRNGEVEKGVNSDSIIVVSIHEKTGEVKMCSVYRDSWLRVARPNDDFEYGRINSAYTQGGALAAIKTLNANLDLNISDYASVNFAGLANIIDLLGGIDINITSEEQYWINQYLTETRKVTGMWADDVYSCGNVHLNGLQAVAFCRIRLAAFHDEDGTVYNNDFGRTARQRRIIMKMIGLAKEAGVGQVMDIANEIFYGDEQFIYTSIPYDEIIDLIPTLLKFEMVGSEGFPYTYTSQKHVPGIKEAWPITANGFTYNVYKLHEFLFNDDDYHPSKTVKNINDMLYSMTGIEEERLPGDENLVID
ncbi:MAG: hypothetical protein GX225_01350 [Clostridiales bacterium]|nr:hypothetical protein [Clostridiales bacterium]